jgi:hypothetical protein
MNEAPTTPADQVPEATQEKILLLIISGLPPSAIAEAAEKLGLTADQVPKAIADAKTAILIAAQFDRREQTGAALVRLNDLYRRSLAAQDTKSALSSQREINKLLDLYQPAEGTPGPDGTPAAEILTDEAEEVAAARRHLEPLGLAAPATPLPELARLAVLRILAGTRPQPAAAPSNPPAPAAQIPTAPAATAETAEPTRPAKPKPPTMRRTTPRPKRKPARHTPKKKAPGRP